MGVCKMKMIYDKFNRVLTIDDIGYCEHEFIKSWIDCNISDVLSGDVETCYITGRSQVNITIVCYGFFVAVYQITDGLPDNFFIQSVGYKNALAVASK